MTDVRVPTECGWWWAIRPGDLEPVPVKRVVMGGLTSAIGARHPQEDYRWLSPVAGPAITDAMVESAARAIREGRQCGSRDEPFNVTCPFCYWGPDEGTVEHDETGCIWLARAALEAAMKVKP